MSENNQNIEFWGQQELLTSVNADMLEMVCRGTTTDFKVNPDNIEKLSWTVSRWSGPHEIC